uniref:Z protein n=1 Tax=Pika arenavirus TaxID=3028231 RepID=A0AAT9TX54_9VIRU|nr:MAG: Z protein [Pika arenavirus]WFG38000.1 MAG: Z protein [Pika arenavirus]
MGLLKSKPQKQEVVMPSAPPEYRHIMEVEGTSLYPKICRNCYKTNGVIHCGNHYLCRKCHLMFLRYSSNCCVCGGELPKNFELRRPDFLD